MRAGKEGEAPVNYRLQLVAGEEAEFFLEDWPAGGVAISPHVVGLFDAHRPPDGQRVDEALADYGLRRVAFGLKELVKIGFSDRWTWTGIRWLDPRSQRHPGPWQRVSQSLGPGFLADRERQIRLLKEVQAAAKCLGPPDLIEGIIERPGGRTEPVWVYATGVVAYDRTPHPLPFLKALAEAAGL